MKEYTTTVTLKITANDHAEAAAALTEAVTDFNKKMMTPGSRRPQRIEIEEISKLRMERE